MIIQCTKKLLEQLKKDPEPVVDGNLLMSWHANFLTINRKKTIILVNDQNRYVIVLHGLKAKEFKNLDELILQSIRNTFEQEGMKHEVIEQYIHSANTITYAKTKNRTLVARMNKASELLYFFEELLDSNTLSQPEVSLHLSRDLVGDGGKSYFRPNEKLYTDLEEWIGSPIFQTKALEMNITLHLKNHHVFRKVIVPINFTFRNLHKVIQIVFGWQDYHLHEFYIFDSKNSAQPRSLKPVYDGEGFKPIMNLVCDPEAFSYGNDDIPMKMDTSVKLSEFMPTKTKYIYDFGDSWIHDIKVERVIEDYDKNYPICIEGEGKTPPEDVGGEHGYEAFLEIIADQNHPDYESMQTWSKQQQYKDFDIELVNRRLKYS